MWQGLSQSLPYYDPRTKPPQSQSLCGSPEKIKSLPGITLLDYPFCAQETPCVSYMSYLSAARSSNGFPSFPDQRQNQTLPRDRHLKRTTLIIRLTWVSNKMQPRHLQASLTPLSRGPGTLQSQRCSFPLSQHIWRAAPITYS